ncbi:MAG: hypothetical protein M3248_08035, partial [Actinomycetota bacterium]|nr:hypothetical protein [Actinomycetota bacterium]
MEQPAERHGNLRWSGWKADPPHAPWSIMGTSREVCAGSHLAVRLCDLPDDFSDEAYLGDVLGS